MKDKKAMISPNHSQLSIQKQCELIHLPRSSYYSQRCLAIETKKNLTLMEMMDKEYTRHPFLGSRKLRDYLRRQGRQVNRKRVQRLMQKMGIMSVAPKPNTSLGNKAHPVHPYLLRDLTINRVNQAWCMDITYIKLKGGFVYLVAVMDWHSRKVLSWELSNSMDSNFCVNTLERAIRLHGTPEIFNTDQGSQYTSEIHTERLKNKGITISMDGKGRATDNICIERFWRSAKCERIYLNEYESLPELRADVADYIEFYNNRRFHETLAYKKPMNVYKEGVNTTDNKRQIKLKAA